jgi:hypothetical protein
VVAVIVVVVLSSTGQLPANERAARSDAAMLLSRVRLPSGVQRSDGEPAGDGGHLGQPADTVHSPLPGGVSVSDTEVDDYAFWTTDASPQSVIAYVTKYAPAHTTPVFGGEMWATVELLQWPPVTNVLGVRQLAVSAMQLADGKTGIRVDAQVTWIKPRPATERIPGGATKLLVSLPPKAAADWRNAQGFGRFVLITSPARIRRATALLNALPLAGDVAGQWPIAPPLGWCTPMLQLTFTRGHHTPPVAVATIIQYGCSGVQLTINGHAQPALGIPPFPGSVTPAASLVAQLNVLLNLNLNVAAPSIHGRP